MLTRNFKTSHKRCTFVLSVFIKRDDENAYS